MKIFGLKEISKKVNEQLFKDVKHKNDPDKWTWKPHNPEKIKNLIPTIEKEKKAVDYACLTNYAISDHKQKVVLIFSIGNLTYGLIKNLEEKGLKFFYIDYIQFIAQGLIDIFIDNDKERKHLIINDLILDLNDVSCVIWNKPKLINPLFDFNHIPDVKGRNRFLFKKRWVSFLKDLPLLLNQEVLWLPGDPLSGSQDWQNKIGEYSLAKKIGFYIPPMIFTNSLTSLNDFASNNVNNDVLMLREFSTPPYSFPPIRVNYKKLKLQDLKNSPVTFQKYIDKKYELRIVVLFDKVFPCKIYSQDSQLAKFDWRVYDDQNVKWELIELPLNITTKLVQLTKKLNLNWCSIDMIYSTDNKYYYLEANRPGAHYWLDMFVGLDITKEIVNALNNRGYLEESK